MKPKTKRPRGRTKKAVSLSFTYEQQMVLPGHATPMLRQAVNVVHIGHKDCNVQKAGVLVTRPGVTKEQERKLEEAHWALGRTQGITLLVTRSLLTGEVIDVCVKP